MGILFNTPEKKENFNAPEKKENFNTLERIDMFRKKLEKKRIFNKQ